MTWFPPSPHIQSSVFSPHCTCSFKMRANYFKAFLPIHTWAARRKGTLELDWRVFWRALHRKHRRSEAIPANAERVYSYPTMSATGIYSTPTSLDGLLGSYVWILQGKPAMKSEGPGMILSAFGNCWTPGYQGSWKAPVETGWSNTLAQSSVNQSKLLRSVSSQVTNISMNGDSKTYYILTGTLGSSVAENWYFVNTKLRWRGFF